MATTADERENRFSCEIADGSVAWQNFIRLCQQLGHGEIEKLKIQDGVPVMAEVVREKVKFK
jgi:hypothetical protein